jgi:hypothetical protein
MKYKFAVTMTILALAGCDPARQPPEEQASEVELRSPAIEKLSLVEGLNLIDRTASGHRLATLVQGDQVTDWQVFDEQGQVEVFRQSDDGFTWDELCRLGGGTPDRSPDGNGVSCCWDNWGCLVCDSNEDCAMVCKTQACRDVNPETNPPPGGLLVTPDATVISLDPEAPGWTLTDTAGVKMHVPARVTEGICSICVPREGGAVCWELPCLPVAVNSADRD